MAYCDDFVYASTKSSLKIQQRLAEKLKQAFGFLELELLKRQKSEHEAELFCYFFGGKKSKRSY